MGYTKIHNLSASLFLTWAMHDKITPKIRGIIEHHVHHISVTQYQALTLNANFLVEQPSAEALSWFDAENMPRILRQSKALMSENEISHIYKDLKLNGRVDQVYQHDGYHILVDTKSHSSVSFRDQLQMSFYALILYFLGYKMYDTAYIRSVQNEQVTYLEVELIPSKAMTEILDYVD